MEKLNAEFGTMGPSDDRSVDSEHDRRVSHVHAKKQKFPGREGFCAPQATAIDRQIKDHPRGCPRCPGHCGRKENGDSRLTTSIVWDIILREDLLGGGELSILGRQETGKGIIETGSLPKVVDVAVVSFWSMKLNRYASLSAAAGGHGSEEHCKWVLV